MWNKAVMNFQELSISGVYLITQTPFIDNRGRFARIICEQELIASGLDIKWKQANQSLTHRKGSFRGIHYQFGPFSEYKLVKCIKGAVLDFCIDLRAKSPQLLQSASAELSESNQQMLLLPPGVGHAFQTLTDNAELLYFHSSFYNKEFEGGLRFDDPLIRLSLPLPVSDISERDRTHPFLTEQFSGIPYEM
jgi:dTDP-4-dehydrorhamnose 3,5-epimerase